MLSKSKQRIAIITIVILVFVLNSMLTSSKDKNTNKLNNTSTSTKEISQPTVVDDTKLSDDIISIEPEESKEQLLTEQNITQVQTQPSVTPALTVTAAPNSREELLIKEIEKQENLRVFRMSEKILSAKDGVIYTVPGKDEYQKLVDSIDRKTGLPTYKIEYNVYSKETGEIDNSQKISKTIKFNHEGKDVELNVSYVEKGNTMVFLPESNKEGFGIYSIRNSDLAILEYKGDLLFVDVDKNIVTPALNDDYGAYNKSSLKKLARNSGDGKIGDNKEKLIQLYPELSKYENEDIDQIRIGGDRGFSIIHFIMKNNIICEIHIYLDLG